MFSFLHFKPLHQVLHDECQQGGRVQLQYIFLIVNHLVFKIGQVIDIVMCNIFKEYFVLLGPTAMLFL